MHDALPMGSTAKTLHESNKVKSNVVCLFVENEEEKYLETWMTTPKVKVSKFNRMSIQESI